MFVSRDATFLEKEFLQGNNTRKKIELEEVSSEPQIKINEEVNLDVAGPSTIVPHEARRSSRVSHPPEWYGFVMKEIQEAFMYGDSDQDVDPTNYEEAVSDIDSKKWLEAM